MTTARPQKGYGIHTAPLDSGRLMLKVTHRVDKRGDHDRQRRGCVTPSSRGQRRSPPMFAAKRSEGSRASRNRQDRGRAARGEAAIARAVLESLEERRLFSVAITGSV